MRQSNSPPQKKHDLLLLAATVVPSLNFGESARNTLCGSVFGGAATRGGVYYD